MSEFVTVLRGRIDRAREDLAAARAAERDDDVDLHAARIEELLDLAERHGVDTATWIDRAQLPAEDVSR
jgi:hypothetical protein